MKFLDVIDDLIAFKTIQKWAKTKGLKVNPSKTKTVLFSRKSKFSEINGAKGLSGKWKQNF